MKRSFIFLVLVCFLSISVSSAAVEPRSTYLRSVWASDFLCDIHKDGRGFRIVFPTPVSPYEPDKKFKKMAMALLKECYADGNFKNATPVIQKGNKYGFEFITVKARNKQYQVVASKLNGSQGEDLKILELSINYIDK